MIPPPVYIEDLLGGKRAIEPLKPQTNIHENASCGVFGWRAEGFEDAFVLPAEQR